MRRPPVPGRRSTNRAAGCRPGVPEGQVDAARELVGAARFELATPQPHCGALPGCATPRVPCGRAVANRPGDRHPFDRNGRRDERGGQRLPGSRGSGGTGDRTAGSGGRRSRPSGGVAWCLRKAAGRNRLKDAGAAIDRIDQAPEAAGLGIEHVLVGVVFVDLAEYITAFAAEYGRLVARLGAGQGGKAGTSQRRDGEHRDRFMGGNSSRCLQAQVAWTV